jgi:hypothetical protein
MIRTVLAWFGIGIQYQDRRGIFSHRYNGTDFQMARPIHENLSVALPSGRRQFYRL